MSEDPDMAAESAEATQSVTEPDGSTAPPPWGDDFDPARAWQTITHLRGREKELESDSNRLKRIREDDDARREFLTELGYELEDDDQDDDDLGFAAEDEPTDPRLQKVDEIEKWVRQKQETEARADFDKHLDTLADEAEVKLSQRDRRTLYAESVANGFNPDATVKAFQDFVEDRTGLLEQLRNTEQERIQKKKGAPHVSPVGSGASDVKNVVDMTDAERVAHMRERFAARQRDSA